MPLTTYVIGEVLTAASLNANLSFAASSPAGGLTLISATTIGTTVSSVTVSSAFSATYDNYKIIVSGGVGSASDELLNLTLGSTTTGYNVSLTGLTYTDVAANFAASNAASFTRAGMVLATSTLIANIDLFAPNLAKPTIAVYQQISSSVVRNGGGFLNNSTQYTAFTFTPFSGTITGGTIRVYGYANS